MPQFRPARKKKLGSYPYAMVLFSITMALLVVGLFGLLLVHAHKISGVVKENLEVQVFLERGLPETQLLRLQRTLGQKPYIARRLDQPQVRFLSKEEGVKQFVDRTGEDPVALLGDNPLRDAFILKLNPEFADSTQLRRISQDLRQQQGVFEVTYPQTLITSVNQNIRKISLVLLGFAVILLLVVAVLINNTIKLALFSQRFLIRSMQLVGATAWFIQKPFLRRATWQGIMGGFLASLLLLALLQYAYYEFDDLALLRDEQLIGAVLATLLVLGGVIGFFSSYRAVRKYLGLSLDELY